MDLIKKELSIKELVDLKAEIDANPDLPEEYSDLWEVADALLKGKVDKAVRLRDGLKSHLEALKSQVESVEWMLDRVVAFLTEATTANGGVLSGQAFELKMQKNSQASLLIEDEKDVPREFKLMSAKIDSPCSDLDRVGFLLGVVLGRVVSLRDDMIEEEINSPNVLFRFDLTKEERAIVEDKVSFSVDKKALKKAVEGGLLVNGVDIERGMHLRVRVRSANAVKKEIPSE